MSGSPEAKSRRKILVSVAEIELTVVIEIQKKNTSDLHSEIHSIFILFILPSLSNFPYRNGPMDTMMTHTSY